MKIFIFATLLFFYFTTPALAQVVISEVYPAPTSEENEWIELFNTSDISVDISGWKLFEHFASKNELYTFLETQIEPKSFFVFELPSSKLNNTEEKVTLENTNQDETSSLYYTNAQSQKSFEYLFENEISITSTLQIGLPTKGFRNSLITNPTPTPEPSSEPTAISTTTPTPTSQLLPKQTETSNATLNQVNQKLELHNKINYNLKLPSLERTEKEGLVKLIPQFSYLVQKKVSIMGVKSAIIGGLLLVVSGLLL